MASYMESIHTSKQEKVLSGYIKLLETIKYCINLLEDLESERGYKNWILDLAACDRSFVNIDKTRNNLQLLRTEFENGLTLHTNLFSLITEAKLIQQTLQLRMNELEHSGMDTSLLMVSYNIISSMNENFYNRISTAVDELENTGIYHKQEVTTVIKSAIEGEVVDGKVKRLRTNVVNGVVFGTLSTATVGALLVLTGGIALSTCVFTAVGVGVSNDILSYYGRERGDKYKGLKLLSDALYDTKFLNGFKSHHALLTEITKDFEGNIIIHEREVTRIQNFIPPKRANSQSITRTPAALDDRIKAIGIYVKSLQENLQLLQEWEPDMSDEMRKRLATKLAKRKAESFRY